MKILFMPQFRDEDKIYYQFGGEVVTVEYKGITDTFDFSEFTGDGELYIFDVETDLPFNPIVSAERKDGILYVRLIDFIPFDSTEEEIYPDWIEVGLDGTNELEG